MKEKILVGIDARPLAYGFTGNSRYLWESLWELLKREAAFKFHLYTNKPIHPVFQEITKNGQVSIAPIKQLPGILWLNFYLPRQLDADKVDIFWGTLQLLPIFKLNVPSIVNYHDLNFISARSTMTLPNYWQHKLLSRFTLKHADRILCLSQNTEREIHEYRSFTRHKTRVVYPGANRPKIEPSKLEYKDYILTVGTLEPRKNLQTLVQAYIQLKQENPSYPYRLILAGRMGWGDPHLAQDLKEGKYGHLGIQFLENPSDQDLLYLYRNCAFFAFPSLHEGFGLPLIEAMVENKCCLGSNIPVFREILSEKNDLFVEPTDVEGWKRALLEMGNRKSLQRDPPIGEEDWSWKKTSLEIEEELLKVYKNRYVI